MKIKNATVLFVLVPFILGTVMLCYCIWAVSTNKNYSIRQTVPAGREKLVWYTEKVKNSDVPLTHVQCIGSKKIFDPHQERHDIFIAEGAPALTFKLNSVAIEDATSVTITVDWSDAESPENDNTSSQTGTSSNVSQPVIIRQKTEAHGLTFIWE